MVCGALWWSLARPDHCVAKLFRSLVPSGARALQFSWLVAPQMCNPAALHRTRPRSHTVCSHAPILPLPKKCGQRASPLFTLALGRALAGGSFRAAERVWLWVFEPAGLRLAEWARSPLHGAHGLLYGIRTSRLVYSPWIKHTNRIRERMGSALARSPKRLSTSSLTRLPLALRYYLIQILSHASRWMIDDILQYLGRGVYLRHCLRVISTCTWSGPKTKRTGHT